MICPTFLLYGRKRHVCEKKGTETHATVDRSSMHPPVPPRSCHPYARTHAKGAECPPHQTVLSRTQVTLHPTHRTPHGASRLMQVMSARSVNTRRGPSRHCRDARLYGRTTAAMHYNEYISPPPGLASVGNDPVQHANHCAS